MFNIVLFEPEIPPNTGNIIRLASNTGCALHLIEPLGFSLDDKQMRRAGLDYHQYSEVQTHPGWQDFLASTRPSRLYAMSTKGSANYADTGFRPGDFLLFGPETRGLPEKVRGAPEVTGVLRIPMLSHNRSLNLSNSAAVVVYEAWRQQGFKAPESGQP